MPNIKAGKVVFDVVANTVKAQRDLASFTASIATGFIGALKTSAKYLAYLAALVVGLLVLYAIYQHKKYPRVKNVLVEKAIKEAKYKKTS